MKSWLYLTGAIVMEVAGTTSMKLSYGFTKLIPSILIFVFYGISFVAMTFALKKIHLSIIYAVWSGVGTAIVSSIGIIYFKEPISLLKVVSIGLIILGVVGLNMNGAVD